MTDRPKKKPGGKDGNDERNNKKAWKRPGARRHRGVVLEPVQKVLMGGGSLVNIHRPAPPKPDWVPPTDA